MATVGPNAFVPITAFVGKQTAVTRSSAESEVIASDKAARSEGLPTLAFREHVVTLFSDAPAQVAG